MEDGLQGEGVKLHPFLLVVLSLLEQYPRLVASFDNL